MPSPDPKREFQDLQRSLRALSRLAAKVESQELSGPRIIDLNKCPLLMDLVSKTGSLEEILDEFAQHVFDIKKANVDDAALAMDVREAAAHAEDSAEEDADEMEAEARGEAGPTAADEARATEEARVAEEARAKAEGEKAEGEKSD